MHYIFSVFLRLLFCGAVAATFPDCSKAPLANTTVCDTSKDPWTRASALVAQFTLDELANNTQYDSPGVPRLGIPAYIWWNEALHGYAGSPGSTFTSSGNFSSATSFPAPITMAAAFDDNLILQAATVTSTESRAFNNHNYSGKWLTYWSPNVNPFRDPRWGRGQETPGEDPLHVSNYAYNFVQGMQNGSDPRYKKVVSHCKHFAAYDMEDWEGNDRAGFNAIVSTQDLAEYYLPPFRSCARDADVGGVMCAYTSVNGIPSCGDSYLLQTILRDHWNWESEEQGHLVVSDCDAVAVLYNPHNYVDSYVAAAADALNAGTDLDCGTTYPNYLPAAYNQSLIEKATLVRAVTRLYAAMVTVGWFDPPEDQPYRQLGWQDVNLPASQALAYRAAVEGTVLIKNDGLLPLSTKKVKNVALIGPWANASTQMQSDYTGAAPYLHGPLYAAEHLGLNVTYVFGTNITSYDYSGFPAALAAASEADLVIYAGGIDNTVEDETLDRYNITWPGNQLDLITELAALQKPTIVLQFGGGQLDDSAILANKNISALVWGGYPGQDGGTAIFDILFGNAAPSGRLPVTQYPAEYVNQIPMTNMSLRAYPGRTYRWYTGDAVVPFGFGLHYTSFSTSFLSANKTSYDISSLLSHCGKVAYLDKCPFTNIEVKLTNTGKVTSDYIALLFLYGNFGPAPYPIKTLVSYDHVHSLAGKTSQTVSLPLTLGSIARVDDDGNTVLYPGTYRLGVDIAPESFLEFTLTGSEAVLDQWPQPE